MTQCKRVRIAITRDREAVGAVEEAAESRALSGERSQETAARAISLEETVTLRSARKAIRVVPIENHNEFRAA